MKKHYIVFALAMVSLVVAMFDTSSGIYVAVFANVIANVITLSRQKSKTTVKRVKKERVMTTDEFREKEMSANPHRNYPRHNPHAESYK
jgi:MFS superfamily sulfate permease-like transporter